MCIRDRYNIIHISAKSHSINQGCVAPVCIPGSHRFAKSHAVRNVGGVAGFLCWRLVKNSGIYAGNPFQVCCLTFRLHLVAIFWRAGSCERFSYFGQFCRITGTFALKSAVFTHLRYYVLRIRLSTVDPVFAVMRS